MINYTEILREHNLKVTPQRVAIANALYVNGHVNIDSLYEVMLKKFDSISLATIYKNVNLMMKNSFIQEVKLPNAKSVYELTKETHSHLVCNRCSSVEDININVEDIYEKTSSIITFHVESVSLIFTGKCKSCQLLSA